MKKIQVRITDESGLHMRPATRLVMRLKSFSSSIRFAWKGKIADGKSILSLLLLCATCNALLEVEVHGEDEQAATQAIQGFFDGPAEEGDLGGETKTE